MSAAPLTKPEPVISLAREAILAEAVRWIGTPYCHQACKRGVGADCLGLIVGVWNAVSATPLDLARHDQRSWAQHADGEPLLDGLRQFLTEQNPADAAPGDVLALRWRSRWPASHLAILMPDTTIVHAYEGGRVVRSNLVPWAAHIATSFAFPDTLNA
jgi:NlpC/P60 family putative phage cell wall peptidase